MNKSTIFKVCIFVLFSCLAVSFTENTDNFVQSPDNQIRVDFAIVKGQHVSYSIRLKNKLVIGESALGIIRNDDDFTNSMKLDSVSASMPVSDSYTLLHGKKQNCSYHANKKVFHLSNAKGGKMDIIFQVSNDGVAFRYYFPDNSLDIKKITCENTAFSFPALTKCWIQPATPSKSGWCKVQPSYEENYIQDTEAENLTDTVPGWIFPALFKSGDTWVHITETFPEGNYCGCRLIHKAKTSEFTIGFPQETESFLGGAVNPESKLPWYSPWRIITLGESLKTIVESTLGTDISKPSVLLQTDYIKPGRSSWSWVLLKDDSTTFDVQKRFVDYAADMGWEYCLVDAFWDKQIGWERMGQLSAYALTRKVGVVVWYNSSGDWNTTVLSPKSKLLTHENRITEFSKLKELGIKGVKVDFFGADGQSMMNYYIDIIKDAAQFGLLVNCHGSTLPRGLQRTYPNLVSMEAIRGFEFVTFEQENANKQANHCCVIPFTRNVFDPMDFTPVCFSEVPGIHRKTSNAFELALSVLFCSGIQHYAETPSGMAKVPVYVKDFLREVPVLWSESKFVDGYPGKFVVIARKIKDTWFVAGINGDSVARSVKLSLPFVNHEKGVMITDGLDNRSFGKSDISIENKKEVEVVMNAYGGFVLKF